MTLKRTITYLLSFVLVSLSSTTLIAQTDYKDLGVKVDSIFLASLGEQTPGAAVAITLNGDLVLSRQYGMANLEHKIPITEETKFHLVSASKQFTAYAILKLENQNLLSLNDNVHKYLPELHDFGITIEQLLTHTSGLRQQTSLESMVGFWDGQILAQGRALELIYGHQELNFSPGSKFRYSDSGYTLLAEIIKRVTDQPFDIWMQNNVFGPIKMSNTSIVTNYKKIVPNKAEPYDINRDGYSRDSGGLWCFYGGTGVYSTAFDLSKWLTFLEYPKGEDSIIVSRMEEKATLNNGQTISWGLGLTINEGVGGEERIWHAGDSPGYHAWVGRYPSAGLGIVILTNLNSFNPEFAADEIAELFIPKIEPSGSQFSVPYDKFESTVLDELVGWYEVDLEPIWYINQGLWEFWQEGDSLFFAPDAGTKIALQAISDSTFYIENDPVLISFHQNKLGVFDALTLTAPEGKQTARKITDGSFKFQPSKAQELTGKYYSPELKIEYEIFTSDEQVMVRHNSPQVNRKWNDFSLQAINQDFMMSNKYFFKYIRFERNSKGKVIGLRVTSGNYRIENLWFEKI
ncbi:serine hydrolase domain-containing protein [Muriicola sp. Z0-33]|uniref:serine hydrolase domain-containing protein n=1 Tax=Muriicola sp. Z0-33 TaxID=2816957 RepID=UPI002238C859|nr:serine hydrolase domain-containing protein [Muriicola sp. Z0-33]MCW5518134.1 beta-lactamase family protein [Muriicola sp. Z0-33]